MLVIAWSLARYSFEGQAVREGGNRSHCLSASLQSSTHNLILAASKTLILHVTTSRVIDDDAEAMQMMRWVIHHRTDPVPYKSNGWEGPSNRNRGHKYYLTVALKFASRLDWLEPDPYLNGMEDVGGLLAAAYRLNNTDAIICNYQSADSWSIRSLSVARHWIKASVELYPPQHVVCWSI